MIDLRTFSIVARDRRRGEFGVAAATARPNVGSLVPFVSLRGAIATQAAVSTDLGRRGLALLEQGVPIRVALGSLLQADGEREIRQVHGLDGAEGFCHTGTGCVAWCGHREGTDVTVAGNMLTGAHVLDAMVEAFERAGGGRELPERLLLALEAGQAAGGDKRGKRSAALLVAGPTPRMYHNLRVDEHADPVSELRRVYEAVVAHVRELERESGAAEQRALNRVKY